MSFFLFDSELLGIVVLDSPDACGGKTHQYMLVFIG
jgi:hypothetical protein